MKDLAVFLLICLLLYLIGFIGKRHEGNEFEFMSRTHTNICRAVAAIIIVFQHVAGGFGVRYFTPLGGIGVAIFLILSGYGLSESYKKKGIVGYWKPKIFRVLIPYLLVCGIYILCKLLTGAKISIPYYWYLDFMLFWYVVFYTVIYIPNLYRYRYIVLGSASVLVFVVGCILNNGLRSEQAISFLIGVWISDNWGKVKHKLTRTGAAIVLLVVSLILLACKQIPIIRMLDGSVAWQLIQVIMKVSASLAIIGLSYKLKKLFNNQMIWFIGGISYEIYLIHFRILWLSNIGYLGMMGFIIITLFGAYLLEILTNKLKYYFS